MPRRFTRTIAATAVCAVAAIGCSHGNDKSQPPPEPPVPVRHDIPALVAVFPTIGAPEAVSWVQWTGDAGAPTAGVRWTDAVVKLSPEVTEAMMKLFQPTDTGRKPRVRDELSADVPQGPFLTGERLDNGFSTPPATSTYAFLDRGHATLVLQATSLD
ncbi:hypothetical protein [Mycolicibacterium cosmeticum]|uniref:hypothetical protein n=1 Tax=Mycolicibacterium cosmeticum TaxID=258533 RepID=UPI00103D0872|nr:hypothetical protein [Mycolicibacterium cosmeticum]